MSLISSIGVIIQDISICHLDNRNADTCGKGNQAQSFLVSLEKKRCHTEYCGTMYCIDTQHLATYITEE